MAFAESIVHQFVSAAADSGDTSLLQPSDWNDTHTVAYTGVVSGGIPYGTSTTTQDYSLALAANSLVIGGGAGAAPFTDAGLTFNPTTDALTVTGQIITSATGTGSAPSINLGASGAGYGFSSGAGHIKVIINTGESINFFSGGETRLLGVAPYLRFSDNFNASIAYATANAFVFGSGTSVAGGATARTEINKAVTAFSDAVAKAVLTFTVPNAAHSASFLIRVVGSLGAGGSVGANESTQTAMYQVDIARTAGVNAVATISAVYTQAAAATVAGGQNIATTAALSAISGDVGASNTFTVNATLTRAGAGATNHTALVHASLLNANATGVTVA